MWPFLLYLTIILSWLTAHGEDILDSLVNLSSIIFEIHFRWPNVGILSKLPMNKCVPTVTFKEGRPTLTCTLQCTLKLRGMEMPTVEVSQPRKHQRILFNYAWCLKTKYNLSRALTVHCKWGQCSEMSLNWSLIDGLSRRKENQCKNIYPSEINRQDCIYLFVHILISPSGGSSQNMNLSLADVRFVNSDGRGIKCTVFQIALITAKQRPRFKLHIWSGQSFSSSVSSLLKII